MLAALAVLLTGIAGAEAAPTAHATPAGAATQAGPAATRAAGAGPAGRQAAADARAAEDAAEDLTGDITFSAPSGTFQGELSVTLGSTVAGAEIRYTTDGQLPTASSLLYTGALRLTATTQLRARPFSGGAPAGEPGTALYVARSFDATGDLPLMVMDAYGAGKPGREYADVATLLTDPQGGTASLSATPTVATRAGFHLHGQSSATFAKTPYRLELWDNEDDDADYPMAGMPADSDWVLRGPFSDKSLIRDALVYSLGRDMGMAAPRFSFVELYLNLDGGPLASADYQGVYMLVETIKNSSDRLDLHQLEESDVSLPEISGGYIFEFEWLAAEEPTLTCTGAAATCWQYLEVSDPSPLNTQQRAWLTQYVQQFHDALHGQNPSDPQTGYPAYIDVDSFADQIILNELSRNMDAYVRSTYFYKDRDEKIVAGPLWDYDLTFGTGGYFQNQQIQGWQFEQTRQPVGDDWYLRLMNDPAFVQRLDARWRDLRQGLLSDASLGERIDALTAPLTAAAQRNFQKWPNLSDLFVGPFLTPTAATWQGQVQYLRDWLTQRAAWLDSSGWQPSAG
ncbi:spore coat protein CotH [Streptomyces hoynatensis]|uniref:Spore coat protein CotH n=1 Tax=Streptomyces hoynatensis TaxID=1141874 RepID=A0A3A9YVL2_9ACTN|nr:spore coat protein CotH [Streptomyces hoynatensis]